MTENTYELTPVREEITDWEFDALVEKAFSTGLAAAIMSEFPVASILAIFKGKKGKKLVAEIDSITEQTGQSAGVKRLLAKIFSIYGFINGIVCTALCAILAVYFFIYFTALSVYFTAILMIILEHSL